MTLLEQIQKVGENEIVEREIDGLGLLRYEEHGPGEWLTKKGEPAKIGRRRYSLDGEQLDSVSSIVDTLDKSGGLVPWAEDHGARGAVQAMEMGKLKDVPLEEVILRVRELGLGSKAAKDDASDRGKAVHAAFQTLATTGEAPRLSDYPEAWRPWMQGCAKAWLKLDPEPIAAEFMVCNPEMGYAGRPDLLCRRKGETILIDYKTGKGRIFEQAHYQTRGYVEAFPYCQIEPPERIVIVGIADDSSVDFVNCSATSKDWQALVTVFRSRKAVNAAIAAAKRLSRASKQESLLDG